ncbi:MAG: TolC family protein [Saprospiraceae bacterium]|nr:TolC family protein [Saprospiraceae bacterium]MBK9630809.1 TolC family protein [Saprospiraceae bacterium]
MKYKMILKIAVLTSILSSILSCTISKEPIRSENRNLPSSYLKSPDSSIANNIKWRNYFTDSILIALIDTALKNNQELNIILQEIEIAQNEIRAKKGEYLPFGNLVVGTGLDKVGKYTRNGAVEEGLEIKPGKQFPEPLGDLMVGALFSWELDVWKKLRNAKKSAVFKYLASVEGKNFMVTNLISEIASSYYELLTLDNQLEIIQRNIAIQNNALQIVNQQKDAARVTQLAVNRFEAQLLNTQNLQYEIRQQIIETENKINFLTARFPTPILRNSASFNSIVFSSLDSNVPSQLLENRPDIRQAEMELAATKLDVKVARANYYPSFRITAGAGIQAYHPAVLLSPESILFNILGDMVAPLINRNIITANYLSSRSSQIQAIHKYEKTILNAYLEVYNQLSSIQNYTSSYQTKSKEVEILLQSITISENLFKSARADYMEVLLTQREALESKIELIEIKRKQLIAEINIYRALGGGWN